MTLDRKRLLDPADKLRRLIRKIDRHSRPEQIHDLRTGIRRFEALWKALSLDERGVDKSLRKRLGRIHKCAGKVRDMDVLTGHASTLHPKADEDCPVLLLEHLGARRHKHAAKLEAEMERIGASVRADLARASKVIGELLREDRAVCAEDVLATGAAASAVGLAVELAAPASLEESTLHSYRLTVKQLRNVLQLSAGGETCTLVRDLTEVKDAIGEWHDWQELVGIGAKVLSHGPRCPLLAELRRVTRRKLAHALSRTGRFQKRYVRKTRRSSKGAAPSRTPTDPVWHAVAALAETTR